MSTAASHSVRSALCPDVLRLILMAAGMAYALPAQAQQAVVTDVTYTATVDNTMDSHYRVSPATDAPTNWRSPVDYAGGTAYVRLEVLTKPGTQKTIYNICFEGTPDSACMGYPPAYTAPGVYNFSFGFSTFWQYSVVDWSKPIKKVALILKDENGTKVQGDSRFYPTKIHVTITLVPAGGTYVPPSDMMKDAGAPVLDAGPVLDAMVSDASKAPPPKDAGPAEPEDAGAPDAAAAVPAVDAGRGTSAGTGSTAPSAGNAGNAAAGRNAGASAGTASAAGASAAAQEPTAVDPGGASSGGCSVTSPTSRRAPGAFFGLVLGLHMLRRLGRRHQRA